MPTIAEFYGIFIRMYVGDHPPPHFHAFIGGREAMVRIEDGQIIQGSLPRNAERMVKEWAGLRRAELYDNWRLLQEHEPANRIEGLE